jgi:hypothetical protein
MYLFNGLAIQTVSIMRGVQSDMQGFKGTCFLCAINELVDALALSIQQLTCWKAHLNICFQAVIYRRPRSSPTMSKPNLCAANKDVVAALFEKATGSSYICHL